MFPVRMQLVNAALNRSYALLDMDEHDDMQKQFAFRQQTILDDEALTINEKHEALKVLNKSYDKYRIKYDEGSKRVCEVCTKRSVATSYCEHCIRDHLIQDFPNWTSGNNRIDYLIQQCQQRTLVPNTILEWIPHENLRNIKYFLTKSGHSRIYTAVWDDGSYHDWDPLRQQLMRVGTQSVILKELEDIDRADQNWFEDATEHLIISNKWSDIVQCFGITRDPLNENYMLVLCRMDIDLNDFLKENHEQLTWKDRIKLTFDIINSIDSIHRENKVHKDIHSRNILYHNHRWFVGDLGFCKPVIKPPQSIYGCLPYIAPEVLYGEEYSFASDIYSIAMLMWEISSGTAPLNNYEHDDQFAIKIANGMRPKIILGTPPEYQKLMEQSWDADPLKRPEIEVLLDKMKNLYMSMSEPFTPELNNFEINRWENDHVLFNSKIYNFSNTYLPKPRNATKAFYTDSDVPADDDDVVGDSWEASDIGNFPHYYINDWRAFDIDDNEYYEYWYL